jgi:hypothetical protein
MNRVRSPEAAVQFDPTAFDLRTTAPEERLPRGTAALLILGLSLLGWVTILLAGRLLLG